tara:strand:+ start:1098 stop:1352 length:255 start_codon:yes stop_codon:yes gene_type:complete
LPDRRTRLHQLLLALIKKEADFDMLEDDSSEVSSAYSGLNSINFSRLVEKNRKIINKYQSIIRTAVFLDALMDSENDENYKIKK